MNFTEQFIDFTGHQASRMIGELLRVVSDEGLIQLTYLGEKLTSDEEVLNGIRGTRALLQTPGHPAKKLFRKILEYLPPKNRTHLFYTLFNNGWFQGSKKRDVFEKTYGFRPPFVMILSPTSQCIRAIRRRQPHNENHLRPCMIIDNPHIFREVIEETKPYFTHGGADEVVTRLKEEMDAYAAKYGELADRVWREEYLKRPNQSPWVVFPQRETSASAQ